MNSSDICAFRHASANTKEPRPSGQRRILGLLGGLLLAAAPPVWAGDDCQHRPGNGSAGFSLATFTGDRLPFTLGGWTQVGYHTDSTGMFNTHPDDISLHQQWLYAERVADGACGLDFGFRVDLVYGLDAQNTQAFGEPAPQTHWDNEWDKGRYGWALPQAYVGIAYGPWRVKAGHFFTLIGHESVPAVNNFFYSHAFTFNFNEPFTHSGVLASYALSEELTLHGGWTAGWDTGFERFAAPGESRGNNVLGGISAGLGPGITLIYAFAAGSLGFPQGEGHNHSFIVDTKPAEDWNYVFQFDFVDVNAEPFGPDTNDRHAVVNYLFHTIRPGIKAGLRAEWFRSGDHSLYEITAGANLQPMANLTIRPELRWQFVGDREAEQFFESQLGIPTDKTTLAIDAVWRY